MDLVILNLGQVTMMTPERASPSTNYHTNGRTLDHPQHGGSSVVPGLEYHSFINSGRKLEEHSALAGVLVRPVLNSAGCQEKFICDLPKMVFFRSYSTLFIFTRFFNITDWVFVSPSSKAHKVTGVEAEEIILLQLKRKFTKARPNWKPKAISLNCSVA
ncbi:hypothetical protein TNCV_644811 [Trichonephila clavipes]|nr:hypothetical protein TNCV_644811 [Trichonephila clavipes]